MAGINCVFLLGRLTRDPQVCLAPERTEIRFGLGIEYRARDATGSWRDAPCRVEVVASGRQADLAGAHGIRSHRRQSRRIAEPPIDLPGEGRQVIAPDGGSGLEEVSAFRSSWSEIGIRRSPRSILGSLPGTSTAS
jgi:hypothetical protein